jgi:hypothetical protein
MTRIQFTSIRSARRFYVLRRAGVSHLLAALAVGAVNT